MTDRADFIADLLMRVEAACPADKMIGTVSELIGASIAVLIREIGQDAALSTVSRLLVAIHEGKAPTGPRPN